MLLALATTMGLIHAQVPPAVSPLGGASWLSQQDEIWTGRDATGKALWSADARELIPEVDRLDGAGPASGARLGADVNGDGGADWMVLVGYFGVPRWHLLYLDRDDGRVLTRTQLDGESIPHSCALADDLDGDDVPDVLVGLLAGATIDGKRPTVLAVSSQTGDILRSFDGRDGELRFGFHMVAPGDLDGDEVVDVVVACPHSEESDPIVAFSGADSSRLFSVSFSGWKYVGQSLAAPGDVTGDGVPDLLVSAKSSEWGRPFDLRPPSRYPKKPGTVFLVCGRSREVLWHYQGPGGGRTARVGCFAVVVGDTDADHVADFVVVSDDALGPDDPPGHITWVSGRTREVMRAISLPPWRAAYARTVDDVDGDGVLDLFVPGVGHEPQVRSGRTGEVIARAAGG